MIADITVQNLKEIYQISCNFCLLILTLKMKENKQYFKKINNITQTQKRLVQFKKKVL